MDLVKDYLMSSARRVFQGVLHQFVATAERINCVQMESQSPVHSVQSVQSASALGGDTGRMLTGVVLCLLNNSLPGDEIQGQHNRMNLTAHVTVSSWVPH